jgi:hypothetical protein
VLLSCFIYLVWTTRPTFTAGRAFLLSFFSLFFRSGEGRVRSDTPVFCMVSCLVTLVHNFYICISISEFSTLCLLEWASLQPPEL